MPTGFILTGGAGSWGCSREGTGVAGEVVSGSEGGGTFTGLVTRSTSPLWALSMLEKEPLAAHATRVGLLACVSPTVPLHVGAPEVQISQISGFSPEMNTDTKI